VTVTLWDGICSSDSHSRSCWQIQINSLVASLQSFSVTLNTCCIRVWLLYQHTHCINSSLWSPSYSLHSGAVLLYNVYTCISPAGCACKRKTQQKQTHIHSIVQKENSGQYINTVLPMLTSGAEGGGNIRSRGWEEITSAVLPPLILS